MRYFGRCWFEKGRWCVKAEPHVNLRIKDVFRQIHKGVAPYLVINSNPQVCKDLEWFMMRYPLEMTESDRNKLVEGRTQYDEKQANLERILLPDYVPEQVNLAKPLRNYQQVFVDLWMSTRKILNGDDVGLGKTVEAIAGAVAAGVGPAIVVVQTHLTFQWQQKFNEFAPDLKVHIIKSRKPYSLPEADVYISTYSKVIGWADINMTGFFKVAIFDECQELRKSSTEKYSHCNAIAKSADYVAGFSATPVYNYGDEMFNIMDLISDGCLGSREEFLREWCIMEGLHWKVKDPKALGSYLRENYLFLRRTRKDVGRELPALNRIIQPVEYDDELAKKFEKDLQEAANRVLNGTFVEKGQAARQLDMIARMMTGVAKASSVAAFINTLLESGEKVLLAGWHREVYSVWLSKLAHHNPVMYTGSESPEQKEKTRQKFMSSESNLMIISLRAGAGLDGLQDVCSIAVIGEPDWSPAVHHQLFGRLRRDGQDSQVTGIFCLSESGTDPLMVDLLGLKGSQAEGIVNLNEEVIYDSDDSRIKRLAEQILARNK